MAFVDQNDVDAGQHLADRVFLEREIGVEDLTWSGRYIADRNFRDFEVFIVLTLLYVLIVFGYKAIFNLVQRFAFRWRVTR